jgi:ATP-dependent exoDNAse (exonuclease V) alpha subunit
VLCQQLSAQGRLILLTASTGAAATRLSAQATTVHSGFKIPANGRYLSSLSTMDTTYQKLHMADIIVIDEMSMLTSSLFAHVLHRLREANGPDFLD